MERFVYEVLHFTSLVLTLWWIDKHIKLKPFWSKEGDDD